MVAFRENYDQFSTNYKILCDGQINSNGCIHQEKEKERERERNMKYSSVQHCWNWARCRTLRVMCRCIANVFIHFSVDICGPNRIHRRACIVQWTDTNGPKAITIVFLPSIDDLLICHVHNGRARSTIHWMLFMCFSLCTVLSAKRNENKFHF